MDSCFLPHSMDPERRAEEIAASYDVVDGPNDEGEPNVEQRNRQQRNEQKGCVLAEKDAFLLCNFYAL